MGKYLNKIIMGKYLNIIIINSKALKQIKCFHIIHVFTLKIICILIATKLRNTVLVPVEHTIRHVSSKNLLYSYKFSAVISIGNIFRESLTLCVRVCACVCVRVCVCVCVCLCVVDRNYTAQL